MQVCEDTPRVRVDACRERVFPQRHTFPLIGRRADRSFPVLRPPLSPLSYRAVELLGIDIGGSGIKGAPVDLETGALTAERHRVPTPTPSTPEAVAEAVRRMARHFDWHGPIGCAFPARIKHGVAQTASNIDKSWIGTNAAALFAERTGCPVLLLNDADAAGVAEMTYGAGRGREGVVLLLTFGTGIGSALFVDHVLVPNTEFGHFYLKGMDVVAEHFAADRARKENDLGWKAWGGRVQQYLTHIEFLVDPDLIILGGSVSKPKKLEKYFSQLKTEADLKPAELQNEAGIIGAAYSARVLQATP